MSALEYYKKIFMEMSNGDATSIADFVDKVRLGGIPRSEVDEVVEYIVASYEDVDDGLKMAVLLTLFQMNSEVGYKLSMTEFPEAIDRFSIDSAYLYLVVSVIVKCKGLSIGLNQDGFDRNMKIAFALLNGINVYDFLEKYD
ncbi:hypothetical protein [Paracidovorax cattleyae]|uniref:hypothetical protein n=1 Tax=Paracidovorax cattleyae TaxID=80868 RepID=UPI0018AF7A9A|nr:hypothetical protein [Paracidovorax cattleyae]MBF9265214.1 hypothetical protein [Paracidovorax cattleyae]